MHSSLCNHTLAIYLFKRHDIKVPNASTRDEVYAIVKLLSVQYCVRIHSLTYYFLMAERRFSLIDLSL